MKTIKRVPIVHQVEGHIEELILNKEHMPGEKLPTEMELCQRLGVGRGTVREAFRLLQARGMVEIKPGRGAFVSAQMKHVDTNAIDWLVQNESELWDSIDIRSALEPMAAGTMAGRGTAQQVERLANVHHAFLRAVERGELDMLPLLDEQFHSAILEGSNNRLLADINQQVCLGMKIFRAKTFQVPTNVQNAVGPHTKIFEAIATHNCDLAEQEMRAHLEMVRIDLNKNIGKDN